jgi:hypothetical protein
MVKRDIQGFDAGFWAEATAFSFPSGYPSRGNRTIL